MKHEDQLFTDVSVKQSNQFGPQTVLFRPWGIDLPQGPKGQDRTKNSSMDLCFNVHELFDLPGSDRLGVLTSYNPKIREADGCP